MISWSLTDVGQGRCHFITFRRGSVGKLIAALVASCTDTIGRHGCSGGSPQSSVISTTTYSLSALTTSGPGVRCSGDDAAAAATARQIQRNVCGTPVLRQHRGTTVRPTANGRSGTASFCQHHQPLPADLPVKIMLAKPKHQEVNSYCSLSFLNCIYLFILVNL